jgi:hypothetical protein
LIQLWDNTSTVAYGNPIKKYAQTTPSEDGISSFSLFDLFFILTKI